MASKKRSAPRTSLPLVTPGQDEQAAPPGLEAYKIQACGDDDDEWASLEVSNLPRVRIGDGSDGSTPVFEGRYKGTTVEWDDTHSPPKPYKLHRFEARGGGMVDVYGSGVIDINFEAMPLDTPCRLQYTGMGKAKPGQNPPKLIAVWTPPGVTGRRIAEQGVDDDE